MRMPLSVIAWCALSLALAGTMPPAHSAPKARPTPAPVDVLTPYQTPLERWCAYLGSMAAAIAADRAQRTPLTTTRARLRQLLTHDLRAWPAPQRAPILAQMLGLADLLYANPPESPADIRLAFEQGCLHPEAPPVTPAQQPWR